MTNTTPAESNAKIHVAVIGAGLIGPRHAQAVQKNPHTTLSCIVDPSPLAAYVASSFSVPLYTSISACLSASSRPIDAVVICTPNHLHVPNVLEVLSLRPELPILVEKPLSPSLADAAPLLDYLRLHPEAEKRILVGHHRRFNSYISSTRTILDSGRLGTVVAISGSWTTYKPDSYFTGRGTWRGQKSTGGGPVIINLIHDVDCLQYLLGPIVRVSAEQTLSTRSAVRSADDVTNVAEEGAAILLRFASGVVGTFILSDSTVSARNFESGTGENPMIPQASPPSKGEFYRFFGTEGSLSVPGEVETFLTTSTSGDGEKGWTQEVNGEQMSIEDIVPFDMQIMHFVDVCRGVERPRCTVTEALSAVAVTEAVARALETGLAVQVGSIGERSKI